MRKLSWFFVSPFTFEQAQRVWINFIDPDATRSCEYNPDVLALPGHLGFLFRPLKSVNTLRVQNKNPSAYGTGIVFDVGHTGLLA